MELVFIKGKGKYDRMDVIRADGARESIDCPKQGIIPHDMVHFAVENTLRGRGFLHRVREGEPANFRMTPDAETDAVERLVEVFQGDGWSGGDSPPEVMVDLYRVTCLARACPMLPIGATEIDAVREQIGELTAQWNRVGVGESLKLAFRD